MRLGIPKKPRAKRTHHAMQSLTEHECAGAEQRHILGIVGPLRGRQEPAHGMTIVLQTGDIDPEIAEIGRYRDTRSSAREIVHDSPRRRAVKQEHLGDLPPVDFRGAFLEIERGQAGFRDFE